MLTMSPRNLRVLLLSLACACGKVDASTSDAGDAAAEQCPPRDADSAGEGGQGLVPCPPVSVGTPQTYCVKDSAFCQVFATATCRAASVQCGSAPPVCSGSFGRPSCACTTGLGVGRCDGEADDLKGGDVDEVIADETDLRELNRVLRCKVADCAGLVMALRGVRQATKVKTHDLSIL